MTRPDGKTRLPSGRAPALVVAALLAASATPAHAKWPTIDVAQNAKLAEVVQNIRSQLSELTQMKSLMSEQLSVFGEFGSLGDLFGGDAFSSIGSKAEFYENMKEFAFDPCAISLCTTGSNPVGTTDITEAMDWAKQTFYTAKTLNNEERRDLEEVRRRAVVYASMNGMALANVVQNDLAGAGGEADALEQIVESSQNLRGDIRANSAIALASYKVELQKLAVLTAMLNVEASSSMAATSIYHEEGGTEFPDAFIDGDYSPNDPTFRVRVTVPEKGSSASPSSNAGTASGGSSGSED